jgi:polyhydroxyalkanoate synthesis repressor PhaR
MADPRVIKKYPNRRLYDTAESRYITLADIRLLVLDGVDFRVLDKRTQEDITHSILLQVIADLEHRGEPLLSKDFLSRVIRCHGSELHSAVRQHLEQSLRMFPGQRSGREGDKSAVRAVPAEF